MIKLPSFRWKKPRLTCKTQKRNLYTKHGINIPEEAKATAEKDFLQKFEKKAADFRAAREQLLAKLASQEREARESPSEAQLKLRLKDVKRRLAAAKAQRGRFRRRVQQSEGKIKGYESEVKEIETLLEYARKAGRTRKPDRAGDQEGGGPTEDKPMTFALPKSNSIHGPSGLVIDGLKGSALYGGYEAIKRIPGLAGFSLDKVLTF